MVWCSGVFNSTTYMLHPFLDRWTCLLHLRSGQILVVAVVNLSRRIWTLGVLILDAKDALWTKEDQNWVYSWWHCNSVAALLNVVSGYLFHQKLHRSPAGMWRLNQKVTHHLYVFVEVTLVMSIIIFYNFAITYKTVAECCNINVLRSIMFETCNHNCFSPPRLSVSPEIKIVLEWMRWVG